MKACATRSCRRPHSRRTRCGPPSSPSPVTSLYRSPGRTTWSCCRCAGAPSPDTRVWARFNGDELIVTAVGEDGPAEVARHDRSTPGNPAIKDKHYPPREDKEGDRTPRANSAEEAAFLALGPGAASWLVEAGAAGARRVKPKMAEAVALAKLHSVADVDRALGSAAIAGRFAENDLIRILTYQVGLESVEPTRASEDHSLQPGTSAWSKFGIADEKEEH